MADNYTAEATNSAGQIFATDQNATSSVHYPIGKIAWGALNTFNLTDTSNPFPVQLFGNGLSSTAPLYVTTDSGAPPTVAVSPLSSASKIQVEPVTSSARRTFVDNNSAHPVYVRGLGSSAIPVTGSVSLSGNNSVVNSSTAPLFVRGVGDSTVPVSGTVTVANPTDTTVTASITGNASVVNSSSAPLFVRGVGSSAIPVVGTTAYDSGHGGYDNTNSAIRVNVVAGSAAGDTTVTVQGTVAIGESDSNGPVFTQGDSAGTPRGMALAYESDTNTNVFSVVGQGTPLPVQMITTPLTVQSSGGDPLHISTDTSSNAVTPGNPFPTYSQAVSSSVGAVQSLTLALSSVAQAVMTEVGRLYGWSMSNPDTADNVWVKIYADDSVTPGTSSALIDVMVPFGGGREADFAVGRVMSSGMAVATAASAGSSVHDTPAGTVTATFYFAPSS